MNAADTAREIVTGCVIWGDGGAACADCVTEGIESAVQAERKENIEVRQALADAAREIPMAGPVADRIRALKEQHCADMQAERDRAAKLVEAAKAMRVLPLRHDIDCHPSEGRHTDWCVQARIVRAAFDTACAAYEVQP